MARHQFGLALAGKQPFLVEIFESGTQHESEAFEAFGVIISNFVLICYYQFLVNFAICRHPLRVEVLPAAVEVAALFD